MRPQLRIHRAPNQTDSSFSSQLEACFGHPMESRQETPDSDGGSDY